MPKSEYIICSNCNFRNETPVVEDLIGNKCGACGAFFETNLDPLYLFNKYYPEGKPEVIPQNCAQCEHWFQTSIFKVVKGHCALFNHEDTIGYGECIVTRFENHFGEIKESNECPSCGKLQNKKAEFCKNCGSTMFPKTFVKVNYCDKCKNTYSDDFTFCEKDGNKLKSIEVEEGSEFQVSDIKSEELDEEIVETVTSDADEELPMKWYKFVTYVMCPFVIIGMIVLILGLSDYEDDIVTFSLLFDCLLTVTLMFGLHNKSAWSWKLLLGLYILNSLFGRIEALDEWGPFVYLIFVIIVNAFTTYPNYIYFNKRKHLFVN